MRAGRLRVERVPIAAGQRRVALPNLQDGERIFSTVVLEMKGEATNSSPSNSSPSKSELSNGGAIRSRAASAIREREPARRSAASSS